MMGKTEKLGDWIESELILKGHNEYYNNGHLTFGDENTAFMQKILQYDTDVETIVNEKIFKGLKFSDDGVDYTFKKAFINKFHNRSINCETFDDFASKVVYKTMVLEDYIVSAYTQGLKYMEGIKTSYNKSDNSNESNSRSIFSNLPQNEYNMDINDSVMPNPDTNDMGKSNSKGVQNSNGNTTDYNLDTFYKAFHMFDQIFEELDRTCFLKFW